MFSWLLFTLVIVFYYSLFYYFVRFLLRITPEHRGRLEIRAVQAIQDLILGRNGNYVRPRKEELIYYTFNEEVRFFLGARPRLKIRIRKNCGLQITGYRIPRFLYAFLEPFLSSPPHFEGYPYFMRIDNLETHYFLKSKKEFLDLLGELNDAGFSFRLKRTGLTLVKTLRISDLNSSRIEQYLHLGWSILYTVSLRIPIQEISSVHRCAYCKEVIQKTEVMQACRFCHTPHHLECFQLNGGCSVFGCVSPRQSESITLVR